jgi:ABC-2 type transport system permease protein
MASLTIGTRPAGLPARGRGVELGRTLRSEFTKIRSVRSTYWSLFLLVVVSLGWGVAFCEGEAAHWSHLSAQARAGLDSTQASVIGVALLGQLVIAVLGALTITSEYSTGMIRTSLTAMPRRGLLFAAKAAVFTTVTLVVAFLASFASFFLGQALLASTHAGAALTQPGVLRAVTASTLYVAMCGLFAFGLGAILRSTAGAITAALGLLFLVPQLARALPSTW